MKNFERWRDLSLQLFNAQKEFDTFALAAINFDKKIYQTFCHTSDSKLVKNKNPWLFDLASLTKPLSFGSYLLAQTHEKREQEEDILRFAEHRAQLVSWGRLSSQTWRDDIFSFPKSDALEVYSDISALCAQVLIEKKNHCTLEAWCKELYQNKLVWWRDLQKLGLIKDCVTHSPFLSPGLVHDPNARNIKEFTAHAGLFGSVQGLAESLLLLDQKYALCDEIAKQMKKQTTDKRQRFYLGFDSVSDTSQTLAGPGCPADTFGHLGFTGTSFWISADKKWGQILLTNATKKYDYERNALQNMRRTLGTFFWNQLCEI
jgi:hypothetical protein